MPRIDYRTLRASISLADVLGLIVYRPSWRRGVQWRGPCPLHGSASPRSRSFAAHLGKNAYYCFRCRAGGNALDLWAAWTQQSLYAAALDLCRRLHQPVPWLVQHAVGAGAGASQDQSPTITPEESQAMPAP